MSSETHNRNDGTVRWNHYGDGKQPWDDILEEDWGPEFCAGNILKYLRRTKTPAEDFVKACWYYDRLVELSRGERRPRRASGYPDKDWRMSMTNRATPVLVRLFGILTAEERDRLVKGPRI